MRKRLVIGAIATVVIGVAAYLLSQPQEGTVEWHEREYWAAFYGTNRLELLRIRLMALARRPVTQRAYEERRERRLAAHEARLIKLGFLEERTFNVFGNHPDEIVFRVTWQKGISVRQRNMPGRWNEASFRLATTHDEIVRIAASEDFSVMVIAPKANMGEWEERIRRADRVDTAVK